MELMFAIDLSRYSSNSFSGIFGIIIFDYFTEQEQALEECYRVIAPGGIFILEFSSFRILDGYEPPVKAGVIKSKPGYLDYVPEDSLLDIRVGRKWYIDAMRRIGFISMHTSILDNATDEKLDWFIGVKPGNDKLLINEESNSNNN